MQRVLTIINAEMQKLEIDYHYLVNQKPNITYPYVTGEFAQSGYRYEDGANECDMLLEVWHRGSLKELLDVQDKIKNHFRDFSSNDTGFACSITFNSCYPRRDIDVTLKKLEIHLNVVYWEGA